MSAWQQRRTNVRPDYLDHPAFRDLLTFLQSQGATAWCTPNGLHITGIPHAIAHERCLADPDGVARGLRWQYEESRTRTSRTRRLVDDTPVEEERRQLHGELGLLQRQAESFPWRGRSYSSKRDLFERYILPWINGMDDSARRIVQQLEMMVVARQQRGHDIGTVPSLIEREYLAFRSDFNFLVLWLVNDAPIGSYSYRVLSVASRLESLVQDVLSALS
jgi:hypothetical protein